ncbi:MAG: phosphate ABC transporter, permease protein PstA, partial [Nitrospirota bacterium]|nr:phosphate ABC transporter, permease protein PstA [Nitrospirota bacterium]
MTRAPLKAFWKSGELFVWLTASGVALSLLMIGALLGLIMVKGLGQFWPADILEIRLADGRTLIGQPINSETIPHSTSQAHPDGKRRTRFRVGNQDAFGYDFKWVDADAVVAQAKPFDLTVFNRREWGPLYGRVRALYREAAPVAEGPAAWPALLPLIEQANRLHERIHRIEHDEIGEINRRLESLRLQRQALRLDNRLTDDETTTDLGFQQTMASL